MWRRLCIWEDIGGSLFWTSNVLSWEGEISDLTPRFSPLLPRKLIRYGYFNVYVYYVSSGSRARGWGGAAAKRQLQRQLRIPRLQGGVRRRSAKLGSTLHFVSPYKLVALYTDLSSMTHLLWMMPRGVWSIADLDMPECTGREGGRWISEGHHDGEGN